MSNDQTSFDPFLLPESGEVADPDEVDEDPPDHDNLWRKVAWGIFVTILVVGVDVARHLTASR